MENEIKKENTTVKEHAEAILAACEIYGNMISKKVSSYTKCNEKYIVEKFSLTFKAESNKALMYDASTGYIGDTVLLKETISKLNKDFTNFSKYRISDVKYTVDKYINVKTIGHKEVEYKTRLELIFVKKSYNEINCIGYRKIDISDINRVSKDLVLVDYVKGIFFENRPDIINAICNSKDDPHTGRRPVSVILDNIGESTIDEVLGVQFVSIVEDTHKTILNLLSEDLFDKILIYSIALSCTPSNKITMALSLDMHGVD